MFRDGFKGYKAIVLDSELNPIQEIDMSVEHLRAEGKTPDYLIPGNPLSACGHTLAELDGEMNLKFYDGSISLKIFNIETEATYFYNEEKLFWELDIERMCG